MYLSNEKRPKHFLSFDLHVRSRKIAIKGVKINSVKRGNLLTLTDIRKVVRDPSYVPTDPKELCNRIFVTCYMGTVNSSTETRDRAAKLAQEIGSYHLGMLIKHDTVSSHLYASLYDYFLYFFLLLLLVVLD